MKSPLVRSIACCLWLVACAGSPTEPATPDPGPPPPAPPAVPSPVPGTVSFACGAAAVSFDLPCQVGLPLAGTTSAVECTAHVAGRTGIVTMLVDLGVPPSERREIPQVHAPTFGDVREFNLARGAVVFEQVDAGKRLFVGRFQDVAFTLDGTGPCELASGPFSGVPGNFL